MTRRIVKAEVINCPGRLGDAHYTALQINVDGFNSPYVLTLAMPAIGFRALSEQADPIVLYEALARAINSAMISVEVRGRGEPRTASEPVMA
jgi:hypothetical protein